MTIINLRDFYYWYTQDEYIEVSDDVAEALRASVRSEAAYTERPAPTRRTIPWTRMMASSIPPACMSSPRTRCWSSRSGSVASGTR